MTDWNLELKRLETLKQNEEKAKRLALVADEIEELEELETQFQTAGIELAQRNQELSEVEAKNSPLITELTGKLDKLKAKIKNIDVEMFVQNAQINNANLEAVKQRNLCNSLAESRNNGELEFARFMASQETLIELEKNLKLEKEKLQDLNAQFYELKAIPAIPNFSREITSLKMEYLDVQRKVESIERGRRQINSRMNFLRQIIDKTPEAAAV
jgi:DNA repair exonuclease SbcCD ATPase subunit